LLRAGFTITFGDQYNVIKPNKEIKQIIKYII
jgi:hypothetical protein